MDPSILKVYAVVVLALVVVMNFRNGRKFTGPMTLARVLNGVEVRQCLYSCAIPFLCYYVAAGAVGVEYGSGWILAFNLLLLLGVLAMVAGARSVTRPS